MTPTLAADHVSADDVRSTVAATPAGTLDLSKKDMSGDDLSGANLTEANLSGANLHGVKLVGANLTGANLTQADLTFAWIIRANFTHARLHSATMQTIVTSTGMDNTPDQAAIFVGADLSDASITVHFSFDDMRGADFSHAHMTVIMANQSMGLLRTEFIAVKLTGANFTGAGLGHVTFRYAKLASAHFNGADLSNAEFDGTDLTDADFTGAKITGASLRECHIDRYSGPRSVRHGPAPNRVNPCAASEKPVDRERLQPDDLRVVCDSRMSGLSGVRLRKIGHSSVETRRSRNTAFAEDLYF